MVIVISPFTPWMQPSWACILQDDGKPTEAETWINANFIPRPRDEDGQMDIWRPRIKFPEKPYVLDIEHQVSLDDTLANTVMNIILPNIYKED